MVWLEFVLT